MSHVVNRAWECSCFCRQQAARQSTRFCKMGNNACLRDSGSLWLSCHAISPSTLFNFNMSLFSLFNMSLFPWLVVLSSFTQIIMLWSVPVPEGGSSDTALHVYPEVSFNKYLNLNTLSNSEPGDKMMHLCSPLCHNPLHSLRPPSLNLRYPSRQIVSCNRWHIKLQSWPRSHNPSLTL